MFWGWMVQAMSKSPLKNLTKLLTKNTTPDFRRLEIMETNAPSSDATPAGGFQLLPLDKIDDPSRPLRTDLTPESVQDLVLSIKQMGIIEPIIVRPVGDRYEIIAGHRRMTAASIAQLTLIPTIVKNIGNEETEIFKKHPPALKLALSAKKNITPPRRNFCF